MANGNFGGGDGTSANPYLIEDADDLNRMRQYPVACFKLVNDINLGVTKYNLGTGWTPIANFAGVLDGNFKKVINLYVNLPVSNNVGFFSAISGALVKNIAFDNAVVIGNANVGVVAGISWMSGGAGNKICFNTVVVSGTVTANSYAAGVLGVSYWGTGAVSGNTDITFTIATQCISNVLINCPANVGGIANTASSTGGNSFCQYLQQNCASLNSFVRTVVSNCVVVGQFSSIANYGGNVFSTSGGVLATSSNVSTYVDSMMSGKCTVTPGDQFVNLTTLDYQATEILPDLDDMVFEKIPGQMINFKWNVDRSYFVRLADGYYVYDFVNKVFVKKYLTIDSTNVHDAVANGNSSLDLLTTGCFELLKTYGEFDVISVQNSATSFVGAVKVASFTTSQQPTDDNHATMVGHVNFADNNGEVGSIETT